MMSILNRLLLPDVVASRWLNNLQPPFALGARWYVSWQFLKSGWLKLTTWDSTIYLFENEYHTPVLWGSILAFLGIYGPGAWSLDQWLKRSPV